MCLCLMCQPACCKLCATVVEARSGLVNTGKKYNVRVSNSYPVAIALELIASVMRWPVFGWPGTTAAAVLLLITVGACVIRCNTIENEYEQRRVVATFALAAAESLRAKGLCRIYCGLDRTCAGACPKLVSRATRTHLTSAQVLTDGLFRKMYIPILFARKSDLHARAYHARSSASSPSRPTSAPPPLLPGHLTRPAWRSTAYCAAYESFPSSSTTRGRRSHVSYVTTVVR